MKNNSSAIIRMFHVHKRYGSHIALADINIDIEEKELLLISGASGAGKSTLLKLLYMGESVSEGQIIVEGMNLSRISHTRTPFLRRKFGIIFQDYKLISTKTVFDNISLVLEVAGKRPAYIQKKVKSILRMVGMEEKIGSFPPSLSGGE
ncbi:MAG: ATP-binding cassette domain-containing protein, partial [Deltaproteobacteria bacterium]|nr:ATP-binding cassette domain-containing protein [Deltaproteobacteria bacterium]